MREVEQYWVGRAMELARRAAAAGDVPVGALVVGGARSLVVSDTSGAISRETNGVIGRDTSATVSYDTSATVSYDTNVTAAHDTNTAASRDTNAAASHDTIDPLSRNVSIPGSSTTDNSVASNYGTILGEGWNTREVDNDPAGHAEIMALRAAAQALGSWRLEGCDLYVTLEPCTMCAGAIVAARVRRVIFGAWDEKAGAAGSIRDVLRDSRLNHQVEVVGGVREAECARQLREFFGR